MFYFFNVGLKPYNIYALCSQEKSYVFSMWDKKYFWLKYFNLEEKDSIFLIWDKNPFEVIFQT
jgi:hypothetical protein